MKSVSFVLWPLDPRLNSNDQSSYFDFFVPLGVSNQITEPPEFGWNDSLLNAPSCYFLQTVVYFFLYFKSFSISINSSAFSFTASSLTASYKLRKSTMMS